MNPALPAKLPHVGTTIFTIMSKLAADVGALNLSQGYPNFPADPALLSLVTEAMQNNHNQYAPMPGVPVLRQAIAEKTRDDHGGEVGIVGYEINFTRYFYESPHSLAQIKTDILALKTKQQA